MALGNFKEAIKDYNLAIEAEGEEINIRFYYKRGNAYFTLHDYEQAESDYKKILTYCTTQESFKEKYKKEITEIEKNLAGMAKLPKAESKLNSKEILSEAWTNEKQGDTYYTFNKDYTKAIECYKKTIELDPPNHYCYGQIAECYFRLDDYTETIKKSTSAIYFCIKGSYRDFLKGSYYLLRSDAYLKLKNYEEAIKDYSEDIKLASNPLLGYKKRSIAYFELQDEENSINDFTKVIELKPTSNNYYYRGNAYFQFKKYQNAIDDYTKAIELSPNSNYIYYGKRGDAYFELGKYQNAIDDWQFT